MEGKNHTGGIILKDMGEHRKMQAISSEPSPATVDETTTITKVRGLNEEVVATKERHPRDATEKVIIRIDNYNNNNNKQVSKDNDRDKDKEWEKKDQRESEKEKAKKKKDKEESPRDWKQMMKSPLRFSLTFLSPDFQVTLLLLLLLFFCCWGSQDFLCNSAVGGGGRKKMVWPSDPRAQATSCC